MSPKIFCAVDTNDLDHARSLVNAIKSQEIGLKLGLEFYSTFGPQGTKELMAEAPNTPLFLDLKFHDIPNTVASAVKSASELIRPAFLNVHASGGSEMMKAAKEACAPYTKLLAVTVLTSLSKIELSDIGIECEPALQVEHLACLTQESGLDGVVCSAEEIEPLRNRFGEEFTLMVPGIRPQGSEANDQKRTMAPKEALEKGANHLVIGRPITKADNPEEAIKQILGEIANA